VSRRFEPLSAVQYERLPKWAQDAVRGRNMEIAELREALRQEKGQHPESRVVANPYGDDGKMYLPDNVTLAFQLATGCWVNVRLDAARDHVEVMADRVVALEPRASNVVWVRDGDPR
jgi:hypothetical protein